MNELIRYTAILSCVLSFLSCEGKVEEPFDGTADLGRRIAQSKIHRVEMMPDLPSPYKMLDWKQKALDYDAYVFDENLDLYGKPLIWYETGANTGEETFGLYTTVNDSRMGPGRNPGAHESLNDMSALIGATLCGIDKTSQNGRNYVKMAQNYFSRYAYGIMMNNPTGGASDWWYLVFPNVLYYALCDLYPDVEGAEDLQRKIADKFCAADKVLAGNYDWSYFDYQYMRGVKNQIPLQQDAAGGHAWVLYSAWKKFGDQNYLDHAISAMDVLHNQRESRFYEVLLPMGILTAAKMNAEIGTEYDIRKMLDWVFDGCKSSSGRNGWGVIADHWGPYDVHGLQGSLTDGGGYAFFMNSVKLAMAFVPMVKYAPQYSYSIGKWMLNLANNCRLFYPDEIDDAHQYLPHLKNLTHGNIAYEGLRRFDKYGKPQLKGISPVALGDGPSWTEHNPEETMFSLYSTSPVGILGAIVQKTEVEGVLRLDCNVTDFYGERPYPVYLYYNPHKEPVQVTYHPEGSHVNLINLIDKDLMATLVSGDCPIVLPAGRCALVTEVPVGIKIENRDGHLVDAATGAIISYK